LKGQLAALRASEEWHRQIQKPEFQRELRLQQFRANGLSSTEEAFLREHLELVDRPDLLAAAHQGEPLPEAEAVEPERQPELQEPEPDYEPEPAKAAPRMSEPPQFFKPDRDVVPDRDGVLEQRGAGDYVSAPVSRNIPTGSAPLSDPTKVVLTLGEREIARMSGISEVEYARNKLRMQAAKRSGQIQG
jgi:hypothetical protein